MTTVTNASVVFKDKNGNVGTVKGASANDITKISNAISDVAQVVNPTTHLPIQATTSSVGVVQLADSAAVSAGTSGRVVDAAQLKDAIEHVTPAGNLMTLDTAQTVTAVKTFSSLPESSVVPTTNNQLVNKKYVDDHVPSITNMVTTDTAQTISGAKTFSAAIIGDLSGNATSATKATQDGDGNTISSTYVKLTGAQTVAGVKTFSSLPESSVVPTTDNQLVNKKFVDDKYIENLYNLYSSDSSNITKTVALHNNVYRGENLLSGHFASIAAICTAVNSGDFSDIFVGDYIPATFTYSGTSYTKNFRVAGIDIFLNHGDSALTRHHLVIVPDDTGITSYMNSSTTSSGGYVGSYMYTTRLTGLYTALGGASGTPFYGHIISQRELLTNATDSVVSTGYTGWSGASSSWAWYDINLVLMSELEVYGAPVFSSSGYDTGNNKQLPLFRLRPDMIIGTFNRVWFWLRSVGYSTGFCLAGSGGDALSAGASHVACVRPRFLIG